MIKLETILLLIIALVVNFLIINLGVTGVSSLVIFFILNISILVLFFLLFKRNRDINSLIKQARVIATGQFNHRILLKDRSSYAELAVIFNEITAELQQQLIENKEAEEVRRRLLSNISHDIRTPLTSILGYVEALKDDQELTKEEKDEYLEILFNKAAALKNLINELFQMARLDAGDFEMNFQFEDLAEIIRECLIDFLPVIKKEEFNTSIKLPEEDCLIYADSLSVERIVKNLLNNSIQYGKEGHYLGVQLIRVENGYLLSIADKGSGIAREELPHVFERLYMGNKSRHKPVGSGLGLAIASRLMEELGGSIDVESIPGEKTVFKLFFPAAGKLT